MSGTAIRLSALGFHGISSIWTVCVGLRERSLTVREVKNFKQDFSEKIRNAFWKQLTPKGIMKSDGRNICPLSKSNPSRMTTWRTVFTPAGHSRGPPNARTNYINDREGSPCHQSITPALTCKCLPQPAPSNNNIVDFISREVFEDATKSLKAQLQPRSTLEANTLNL